MKWMLRDCMGEKAVFSLFRSDSEATPDSSLLEVARSVELLEFIFWCGPAKTVISEACKAPIRLIECHGEGSNEAHMRDAVEDYEALRYHNHRS